MSLLRRSWVPGTALAGQAAAVATSSANRVAVSRSWPGSAPRRSERDGTGVSECGNQSPCGLPEGLR